MIKAYFETYWEVFKLETRFFLKYWWVIIIIGIFYLVIAEMIDRSK